MKSAVEFASTLKINSHRSYAERLIAYYRDYGTPQASGWPSHWERQLPNTTCTRIGNTIRHYLVGDCPLPRS
jgi:hypothetical protein